MKVFDQCCYSGNIILIKEFYFKQLAVAEIHYKDKALLVRVVRLSQALVGGIYAGHSHFPVSTLMQVFDCLH